MSTPATDPKGPVLLAVLSVLAALAAGVALGIFLDRALLLRWEGRRHGEGPPPDRVSRWLDRRLDLDDAQRAALREVLDRRRDRFQEIAMRHRPEVEALRDSTTAEIRALLRPDQREKYDRMLARRERGRGRRGPPVTP
jgi:Spy/CpxP family protein refolding chaperone